MDQYSFKEIYEKLVRENEKVNCSSTISNRLNVPKHRFIMWLIVQQKLQTTSRPASIGVSASTSCLIYDTSSEDHAHLFFTCAFQFKLSSSYQNMAEYPGYYC